MAGATGYGFGRNRVRHGVVRTDLLQGTDVRSSMVSIRYLNASNQEAEIDNGNIVSLAPNNLIDNTFGVGAGREYTHGVFEARNMAVDTPLENLILVATPELMHDERYDDLADFYNEAGTNARGYRLRSGDIFSVTAEALTGTTPFAVGNFVNRQVGTRGLVAAARTAASFGKIIEIETVGTGMFGRTYYVILVL